MQAGSFHRKRSPFLSEEGFCKSRFWAIDGYAAVTDATLDRRQLVAQQIAWTHGPYRFDINFLFGLHTEVHFVIVTTVITSQSAYADSSPQGEPLSIITFEKGRKQLIALQVEIRSRYFGNGPNKDFYLTLHNKKETRGSIAVRVFPHRN